ncbi:MAG: nuclear transport factor 2 family protein [Mucilaginibacter sp.]|nr:nuclear transport factor 2 family protein [Mucilaginibacter sp.]
MTNKEIIFEVIEAFDRGDGETITKHMTDDVEWHILGDKTYTGKEALKKFFADNTEMKMLSSTKDHVIIDGDNIAVNGQVQCTGPDGEFCDMYYCDIYELENYKVKRLITYIVNKKK